MSEWATAKISRLASLRKIRPTSITPNLLLVSLITTARPLSTMLVHVDETKLRTRI